MTFREFSSANRLRCQAKEGFNHPLDSWSLSDWLMATLGELGEAANVGKKLNRIRDGIPGNKDGETAEALKAKLGREIADAFCYLDLLAQANDVNLADVVPATWNAKSEEIGYPGRLEAFS